jgi:hypothetical protein
MVMPATGEIKIIFAFYTPHFHQRQRVVVLYCLAWEAVDIFHAPHDA